MRFRFRISSLLWGTALFAVVFATYKPALAALAAGLAIAYWWIIYCWYEEEHKFEHVANVAWVAIVTFEIAVDDDFIWPRHILILLLWLLWIAPLWRKREPWYEKYL